MVRHIVTFKLNGSPDDRRRVAQEFVNALLKLPTLIPVLKDMEAGVNVNPAEDWDVALVAAVDNLDDVATYANHPAHLAAAALVAPYKVSRACVDFIVGTSGKNL